MSLKVRKRSGPAWMIRPLGSRCIRGYSERYLSAPGIGEIVHTDLRNMRRACAIYEWFDPQPMELLPLVDELAEQLPRELDHLIVAECEEFMEWGI